MSKKIMAYIRVSGLGQVDKDGPIRQKEAILAFVTAHNLELDPANIYEEKGVSGTIEGSNRPAFAAMFARVEQLREAGIEIVGIVCERLDRLARTLHVSELLLEECRRSKLAVFSTDQGDLRDMASDGGDPMRVLLRQFMGALNEYQKSELVKKLKIARDRIRKETGRCEGRKQYGTFQGELPCLQTIEMLYKQGQSAGRIANELNTVGFRNRKGGLWIRQTIEHLIKSRRLTTAVE